MIHGLISLTLLLFSYETKFLTSCYTKNNICQIWAFLTEGKSNVFRGQNSLSSARVSAGVIYKDAGGTVGHKLCEKSTALPAEKDELKYITNTSPQGEPQSLLSWIYELCSLKEEGTGPSSQGAVSFPFIEKARNTHCKTAWVCIFDHPEV